MSLTTEQAQELAILTEARASLLAGNRVAKISRNGRAVEYTAVDMDRLNARIGLTPPAGALSLAAAASRQPEPLANRQG